jgi:hypothetical protein
MITHINSVKDLIVEEGKIAGGFVNKGSQTRQGDRNVAFFYARFLKTLDIIED